MDALEMVLLLDHYGGMLTEKQRSCFDMRYNQDLSLGEIAAEMGISRQGVHDIIKRCHVLLEGYEDRLGLVKRFLDIRLRISKIRVCGSLKEAQALAEEILDIL